MSSLAKRNYLSELKAMDWDFHGQSGQDGLSAYHWYPARYVPQVPGVLIGYLSSPGDHVLDPFCGSGTTLVEARRLGRSAVGIDINPVATLTAKSKLIDPRGKEWDCYITKLKQTVDANIAVARRDPDWLESVVPNLDEQRDWYHSGTLEELASIWEAVLRLAGPFQPVADVAFSGILRYVCSQDKHWGWICDNVKPSSLSYKPAWKPFFDKLIAYPALLADSLGGPASETLPGVSVQLGKCSEILQDMASGTFDLAVTSPPYFSMTDYIRSQRLTFLWQDWDLDAWKSAESGARFKRHRRTALSQYLGEMRESFAEVHRVLKAGASCAIVIGESPSRDPYLDDFRDDLVRMGFRIEARLKRRVATQRTFAALKHEEIIIAKKV